MTLPAAIIEISARLRVSSLLKISSFICLYLRSEIMAEAVLRAKVVTSLHAIRTIRVGFTFSRLACCAHWTHAARAA